MALRPLGNRVVIERVDAEESVKGGIIIPDSAKEKGQEAVVVAVGPGKKTDDGTLVPMDVKVGDHVLIGKYSGSDVNVDGADYVIVTEDEILGVLEGSKKSTKKPKKAA